MEPITAEVHESDAEVVVELSMDELDRVGGRPYRQWRIRSARRGVVAH